MNKRTSHGMIFVPLLCLLAALLGCIMFARAREDAAQPIASESVSEAVGIFQSPVLEMPEALASALIFDPLPSDEPVNTAPPRWRIGFVRLRTKRWSSLLCLRWRKRRVNPSMGNGS